MLTRKIDWSRLDCSQLRANGFDRHAAWRDRGLLGRSIVLAALVAFGFTAAYTSIALDDYIPRFSERRISELLRRPGVAGPCVLSLSVGCRRAYAALRKSPFRESLPSLYSAAMFSEVPADGDFVRHMMDVDSKLAVSIFLRELEKKMPLSRRLRALRVLSRINDERVESVLKTILKDSSDSPFIRREVFKRLADSGHGLSRKFLLATLDDKDRQLRRLAAKSLVLENRKLDSKERYMAFCALNWRDVSWFGCRIAKSGSDQAVDGLIAEIARVHDLEAALIKAIVKTESNFNVRCVSRTGARGLMQLMPRTAASVGVDDPFEPRQNVLGGVKYLKRMLGRFNGDLKLALAAYNAGPGAVDRYGGVPPYRETRRYIAKVFKNLKHFRGES